MKALVYKINPLAWATCYWLKHFWRGCLIARVSGLALRDVAPPPLRTDQWVRVRTCLAGICGTDLAILTQRQPPSSILQAFSSQPIMMGHENVGVVEEVGRGVAPSWVGKRVCVDPTLSCIPRGIDPPCEPCQNGAEGTCENLADKGNGLAKLPPGTGIGYNNATGGTYGEQFVAHVSQLNEIPEQVTDEQAALADSLACGVHAVLRANLTGHERVLVYGLGAIGLSVVTALRATGFRGHVDALGRHAYLADHARDMGADAFLQLPKSRRERFEAIAQRTGGRAQRVRLGNRMLIGGYDVVFECVGVAAALTEALKWTRADGTVVLLGSSGGKRPDLTPVWFRQLRIIGVHGRHQETFEGQQMGSYPLTLALIAQGRLNTHGMLTHTFPLSDYRSAFDVAMNKARHQAIKVAFDFR